MGIFSHKKKDEELLKELEKDLPPAPKKKKPAPVKKLPPAPKPPAAQKPAAPKKKPALSTEEVANLPLFMKVDEYDKIVKDLAKLNDLTSKMDETLAKMKLLESEEEAVATQWKEQLDGTKSQIKNLVATLPESGRLKQVLKVKNKKAREESLKKELDSIKKNLKEAQTKPDVGSLKLSGEVGALRDTIKTLRDDMKQMHTEVKALSSETKKTAAAVSKEKVEYKKTRIKNPWK